MRNKTQKNCLILNFWCCKNYGALMTCYGVYLLAKEIGLNAKIINYLPNDAFARYYPNSFSEIFANKHLELTNLVKSDEEFKKLNKQADIFIAGSDQIWNAKIVRTHHKYVSDGIYQLDFVHPNKKKISYSASFGTETFNGDDEEKDKFAQRIKNFDAISVREDTGVKILENDFNTKSTQLIDGAFLIPEQKLKEITGNTPTNEKYIGCYALPYYTDKIWYKKHLKKISKKYNLPIKYLQFDSTTPVEEWLSFIKNAELLISDSYHAIVFSIIFRKPFIQLQNSPAQGRFNSLYKLLELDVKILTEESSDFNCDTIDLNTNWEKTNTIIKNEVQKAKKWLTEAIQ